MSYILDALQRADAERARGGVPTLHARPLAGSPLPHGRGTRQRLGLVIAVFVVILGIAAAAWWMWRSAPTPVPTPTPVAAPAPPLVAVVATPIARPDVVKPTPPPMPPKVKASAAVKPAETPKLTPALAPLLSELPEATRRQIPSMTISGAVYSDNPSQRLLLVNGQVLNQGSQVAPDLTVVEIHSNNTEFNFRGTRFRMAH